MAHAGHIFIPMPVRLRLQAEWHEFDAAKRVWRRPWAFGERKRMSGTVKEVHNIPFVDRATGTKKTWNPLQVAVFAVLNGGVTFSYDVVRVFTPTAPGEPGAQFLAEVDFSVMKIRELLHKDSIFYAEVMDGKIRLEDEATNEMPQDWVITQDGTFAPEHD
jgi:hypothetical protein